jgi:hypothetical protein
MNSLTVSGNSHFKKRLCNTMLTVTEHHLLWQWMAQDQVYKPDYFSHKLIRSFPSGQSDIFGYKVFVVIQITPCLTKCSLENHMIGETTMCKAKTVCKI